MALNKNAKKWVATLRSGVFKQAKQRLTDDGGFCCLGVACVLAANAGVIPPPVALDGKGVAFDGEVHYLPASVEKWLGLRTKKGYYQDPKLGYSSNLGVQNDSGRTFFEIADIIESEPEGLFQKVEKKPRRRTRKGKK